MKTVYLFFNLPCRGSRFNHASDNETETSEDLVAAAALEINITVMSLPVIIRSWYTLGKDSMVRAFQCWVVNFSVFLSMISVTNNFFSIFNSLFVHFGFLYYFCCKISVQIHINRTPKKSIAYKNGDFMPTSNTIFSVKSLYSWLSVSSYLTNHVSLVILKDNSIGNSFPDLSVVGATKIVACELCNHFLINS